MAGRISELTAGTPNIADADLVEVSVSSGGSWLSRKFTFAQLYKSIPKTFAFAASDNTTALTVGDDLETVFALEDMVLSEVWAGVKTLGGTSGTTTIMLQKNGSDILSTALTIDFGEATSLTAATPAVISTADISKGDKISVDIDAVTGDATEAGLEIFLVYTNA